MDSRINKKNTAGTTRRRKKSRANARADEAARQSAASQADLPARPGDRSAARRTTGGPSRNIDAPRRPRQAGVDATLGRGRPSADGALAGITGGAPAKKLVLQFMEQHEFREALFAETQAKKHTDDSVEINWS